ncbi:histidine phosphatase family protein [Acinetobacter sp. WCHAc060033]|uniref:histidine phosphatase family protein n=1 Tax=Acinetobacter sp. WCHAc060033 TaxID=2518624 RepID=UPI001023B7BE|nr:histidine phosphatase family protein [Acinetobacter sp. WCHAc060033]RZG88633.1 histidine phosphatase family protein [Acinetobacter sp. WCHAc060033]
MKLRIDLLRHGETTLSHTLRGSTDDELTELGWQQMQQTIDQHTIVDHQSSIYKPWNVIFTSPLQRCFKFAEKLATDLDLGLITDPHLQEMHFGDWEGISTQQIYDENPELLANFWQYPTRCTPPNAEKLIDFQQRVLTAIADVGLEMQQKNHQNALIVTHGGVIKLLKCLALQQPLDDILKMSAELGQLNCFILDSETMQLEWIENKK